MIIKKDKVLSQWLDEQLTAGLIKKSKSRYVALYFYIPKKDGSLWLVQDYQKLNCHKLHSACISTTSGLIFTN